MTTIDSISERKGRPTGRQSARELSPNAPGASCAASIDLADRLPANLIPPVAGTRSVSSSPPYDEVDRRLMDTFPASDAVARY